MPRPHVQMFKSQDLASSGASLVPPVDAKDQSTNLGRVTVLRPFTVPADSIAMLSDA